MNTKVYLTRESLYQENPTYVMKTGKNNTDISNLATLVLTIQIE